MYFGCNLGVVIVVILHTCHERCQSIHYFLITNYFGQTIYPISHLERTSSIKIVIEEKSNI